MLAIEEKLLRWYRWNQIGDGRPKKPPSLIGKIMVSTPDPEDVAPLSDAEAEEVNAALARLKWKYPKAYQAIFTRYGRGVFDDKKAARLCGCSKTTLHSWRLQGHAFLDGYLS